MFLYGEVSNMMEVSLRKGEGPRILAVVHPVTNKVSSYRFEQGTVIELPEELARLIKDLRFKVQVKKENKIVVKVKAKPSTGVDKDGS